jgi:threonine 3-dehydrogenase
MECWKKRVRERVLVSILERLQPMDMGDDALRERENKKCLLTSRRLRCNNNITAKIIEPKKINKYPSFRWRKIKIKQLNKTIIILLLYLISLFYFFFFTFNFFSFFCFSFVFFMSLSSFLLTFSRSYSSSTKLNPRILITGGLGQIGTELVQLLRKSYGGENVILSDVKRPPRELIAMGTKFYYADVTTYTTIERIVVEEGIDWIVHNASILSAAGERNPQLALQVNVDGIQNVLELARRHNLRIFAPSSIAAFGLSTPKTATPDITIMRPNTIYGVSKVYLELLGEYYHSKYGVDFRSLRYPGILSAETEPGGGTTDYAIDIFWHALKSGHYECFLAENSELPMMYMPDCLQATIKLLEAPQEVLTQRVYNVAAYSFTPKQLYESIKRHIPNLTISYKPDFRQQIADSWPKTLDDSKARADWGWKHTYDLEATTDGNFCCCQTFVNCGLLTHFFFFLLIFLLDLKDMLEKIRRKLGK